jgi:PUA domain protein
MKKAMRNKGVKQLIKELNERFDLDFSKKDKFEIDDNIILVNNQSLFFYYDNKLLPTLKLLLENNVLKTITVDMGAVKFVTKGADIMRPGITKVDDNIEKNEFVAIVDETHLKPLAIGLTLFSGKEILNLSSGNVIKNIHYVGDSIWNYV